MLVASKNENFLDQNIDWEFPIPIAYGPGRLSEIGLFCEQFQISNPLIITDEGSKNLPFINRLITLLQKASIPSKLFFGVSPNPRDDEIMAGCETYRSGKHDSIIAIGGGSAMTEQKPLA